MQMEKGKYDINNQNNVWGQVNGDNTTVTMNFYSNVRLPSYRVIEGDPPATDLGMIQQRQALVGKIYNSLMQPGTNALALTGIGGIGKSTLAALLFSFVKTQLSSKSSPFVASPLWLAIDEFTTFADIMGTLYQEFKRPMPDLKSHSPASQARMLNQVLADTPSPRFIVLDAFEHLLDEQTGNVLDERPGVGEWIDALNDHPWTSGCRLIMTSKLYPRGRRAAVDIGMHKYPVDGLAMDEGVNFLRKQIPHAKEGELRKATEYCSGHVQTLKFFGNLVALYKYPLSQLLEDQSLWTGNIAKNLLDSIFEKLNPWQRRLLYAFSVYRTPVPVEVAIMVVPDISLKQAQRHLQALLIQHLIQATSDRKFQLHSIVAAYARERFEEDNGHVVAGTVLNAHEHAANYYLQQAVTHCLSRSQRQQLSDVLLLIEATWHYGQATQWQKAYELMLREGLFLDLKNWGNYATLLDLYTSMFPLEQWLTDEKQRVAIYNNVGRLYSDIESRPRARSYYQKALAISQTANNRHGQSRTLNNLGWLAVELEDWPQAQKYFQQTLCICREIGDYRHEASALNGLGRLYDYQGEKEQASQCFEQALQIYQEHQEKENAKGTAWALSNLGKVHADLGKLEQARDYFRQALVLRKEQLRNQWEEGRTLKNLGIVYARLQQKEASLSCLEEALQLSKLVGDRRGEGRTLNALGQAYATFGENVTALDYFHQALAIHQETEDSRQEAKTRENIGDLLRTSFQSKDHIEQQYAAALHLYKEIGDQWGAGNVELKRGVYYVQQDQPQMALAHFFVAREMFEAISALDLLEEVRNWMNSLGEN